MEIDGAQLPIVWLWQYFVEARQPMRLWQVLTYYSYHQSIHEDNYGQGTSRLMAPIVKTWKTLPKITNPF